jgi:hypothetical protein
VQVRIVHKSADSLLAEQRGFVKSAIPLLRGEIAVTDAHQGIQLGAPLQRERAYRLAKSRQLLGVRRQGFEAEQSRRIVFASTGFWFTQILLSDIAEKLVALYTGDLCQQRDEMRLIFVQRAQHVRASDPFVLGSPHPSPPTRSKPNRQRRRTTIKTRSEPPGANAPKRIAS